MRTKPLKERVKSAYQSMSRFLAPNPARSTNGQTWLLPAKRTEFKNVDAFDNGAVMACLKWTARNFKQAQFQVYRETGAGIRKPRLDHPLLALLKKPTTHYGYYHLMAATLLSYDLDGNAYWLKERGANGFGLPERLWYVPHWMMRPHTEPDSPNFIDYYLYTVNGAQYRVESSDVVHFRNDLDPSDVRKGYSGLKGVLREIFGDEEASVFAASLLKNMGIPGVVISPGEGVAVTSEAAEAIKDKYQKRMTGSERGKPLILDFAGKIDQIGLSPVDMATVEQRLFFEQRICAVLGIAPSVVNLPSGSKNAQSYNNLVNLRKAAFEENLCPRWMTFAEEIEAQLLPDFPNALSLQCGFDTRNVDALKESENDRAKREREKFHGGGQTWNEYRTALGMPTNANGEWLLLPGTVQPITLERIRERAETEPQQPEPTDPTDPNKPDDGKGFKKKAYEWEGVELGRAPNEWEAKQLGVVMAAQDAARGSFTETLRPIRARLVESGLQALGSLTDPREGLSLLLTLDEESELRKAIQSAYQAGRDTARVIEKAQQKDFIEVMSRVWRSIGTALASRVTGRLMDEYARGLLRGLKPAEAVEAVRVEMEAETAAYVEELASGAAYESVGNGRFDELTALAQPGDRFIYSAILDKKTCVKCKADDLKEAERPDQLPHAPNRECKGRWRCRCMIVIARD